MPYSNTPGKHLNFWSGTVSTATQTIFTVPTGYTFYLDYVAIGCFVLIPSPAVIYVAGDGVPLMLISALNQTNEISFPKPIIIPSNMTIGPLGNLGSTLVSSVVTWSGEVR